MTGAGKASGTATAMPSTSDAASGRPIACAMRGRRASRRIESACALKRITAGRNTALSVPWCSRGLTPPRLCDSECTQPSPFWKAIAPCMLALIMAQRAWRSLPSRTARSEVMNAGTWPFTRRPSRWASAAMGFTQSGVIEL